MPDEKVVPQLLIAPPLVSQLPLPRSLQAQLDSHETQQKREAIQQMLRRVREKQRAIAQHERLVTDHERLVTDLVKEFRSFHPKPEPEPYYPNGFQEISIQKTRLWFKGYERRVSRRSYLKAVKAYEQGNLNQQENLQQLGHPVLLFPPLTKTDLRSRWCLKDRSLPVLKHVRPGAGRRPRGRASRLYVLVRDLWYKAEQRGLKRGHTYSCIHYVMEELQKKRVDTGDRRYGTRWPEFYNAHPRRVWKLKQRAFNSPNAEID